MGSRKGALEGIRILDLTRVLAGPFCTMIFADMGAEVIKIERPLEGDDTRQMGPFKNGESAYFMNLNRNKKGITLNLKNPKGKAAFLELVKKSDVVVENYRPGTMEKLGLGYEDLKQIKPSIVYAAISGFGHTGQYRERPGYDIISQAMSGLMSTTGWPDSEPTRTGTAMGDILGGLSCSIGILAAIYHLIRTGEGQKVDVALVDSAVASLEIINMIYIVEGRIPQRIGNRYESTYPYDSFRASDGSLVIGAGNDKLYARLCDVIGKHELVEDSRFLRVMDRVAHHAELKPLIEEWTSKLTVNEVCGKISAAGVPCAPIYDIEQVVNDPHISKDREMFVEIDHPVVGPMKVTGSHIKLSETPPCVCAPSPSLGEHNGDILGGLLELSEDDLKTLREEGAI